MLPFPASELNAVASGWIPPSCLLRRLQAPLFSEPHVSSGTSIDEGVGSSESSYSYRGRVETDSRPAAEETPDAAPQRPAQAFVCDSRTRFYPKHIQQPYQRAAMDALLTPLTVMATHAPRLCSRDLRRSWTPGLWHCELRGWWLHGLCYHEQWGRRHPVSAK